MTIPCPVCLAQLGPLGKCYTTQELFDLLKPVRFSPQTFAEHNDQSEATELYRCTGCGLEIFLPPIIATPQFYIEAYKLDGSGQVGDFSYSDKKWDFDEAAKDLRTEFSILEIGCGPGSFLDRVKSVVRNPIGVEFNESALDAARHKGHRVFELGALPETLRGTFDAVFSFHVLEHVLDPFAFLKEAGTWARPGGLIGISLPNQDGPIRLIEPCIQNMPPHHATRWRDSTFKASAHRLDWRIERVAFEPLTENNAYYYSTYLGAYLFPGKTPLHVFAQQSSEVLAGTLLKVFFATLRLFGRTSTNLLKGQAMYVAMRKRGESGSFGAV